MRSRRTRSGRWDSRASAPSEAVSTANPSFSRYRASTSRTIGSSSTTSTRDALTAPLSTLHVAESLHVPWECLHPARPRGSPRAYTSAVVTCPNCGKENLPEARFCMSCGMPLIGKTLTEERRLVTVLFCDLVGFTDRSDRADPEDVKATLRPFHARLKREIEAFGGTLDKFIGDAALGVFGSPVAHEDDPERAVRAGLAILEAMEELNEARPQLDLAVRIGIDTGEAVVAYGSGPQIGEAVTGDVVNTASRLQSVAPAGGIVVGEATFGATRDVFVF